MTLNMDPAFLEMQRGGPRAALMLIDDCARDGRHDGPAAGRFKSNARAYQLLGAGGLD